MDRRVKERLAGATILVLLIVLIVPELLSGPPAGPVTPRLPTSTPEPVRNVTVDLATSKPQSPESAPVVEGASAPADAAMVLPAVPARVKSSAPLETAPLETTAPPPTSNMSTVKSVSAGHGWAVQLGSFASRANADKLAHQLKAQGFSVYVLSGGSGSSARYRVRIGPMADRGAAAQVVAKLKSLGHMASFVPPGP